MMKRIPAVVRQHSNFLIENFKYQNNKSFRQIFHLQKQHVITYMERKF